MLGRPPQSVVLKLLWFLEAPSDCVAQYIAVQGGSIYHNFSQSRGIMVYLTSCVSV